jgi:osmotically-inducible protein OsmY
MSRWSLSQFAALSAALAWMVLSGIQTASAQSLFGGSGSTNRGTTSSAGTQYGSSGGTIRSTSPTSGFSNSFGSTSAAGALNSGFGGTGGLNTAAGGTGTGTALAGPQIATQLGQLSATIGQGGFIGQADNAGRFVGNQNAGTQSLQATSMSGGQFGGGQFASRGQGQGQNGFNQQNNFSNQQNRRTIRPQQKIAFQYPQRAQETIQTRLNTQFERLQTTRPELEGVEIVLAANNEVVLRGQVRTEEDKKLAAMYARMEPGVRSIKNELTIEAN